MSEKNGIDIKTYLNINYNPSESKIVEAIIKELNEEISVEEYEIIKRRNIGIFELYEHVNLYMSVIFDFDISIQKFQLYLAPKNPCQKGICIGFEGGEYIVYQYLNSRDEFISNKMGKYEIEEEIYQKEIARTRQLSEISKFSESIADHYFDERTYTVPLSLDVYSRSEYWAHDINTIIYIDPNKKTLTEEEHNNLRSFIDFAEHARQTNNEIRMKVGDDILKDFDIL